MLDSERIALAQSPFYYSSDKSLDLCIRALDLSMAWRSDEEAAIVEYTILQRTTRTASAVFLMLWRSSERIVNMVD